MFAKEITKISPKKSIVSNTIYINGASNIVFSLLEYA